MGAKQKPLRKAEIVKKPVDVPKKPDTVVKVEVVSVLKKPHLNVTKAVEAKKKHVEEVKKEKKIELPEKKTTVKKAEPLKEVKAVKKEAVTVLKKMHLNVTKTEEKPIEDK